MPASSGTPRIPRCTYRVQLHAGFTFDDLAALVPYLNALGVSDCYCSPVFRPTPGSRHGYDVCDYRLINPELGGEEALRRLSARLREHDMGLLLDFVPNHMGIDGPFNRWWRDVLEHGLNSTYASFFDIHWNDRSDPGRSRVFVPLLPEHYGVLLEQGKLRLVHEDGALALIHEQTRFPLRPETYAGILRHIVPPELAHASGVSAADPTFWKQRLNDVLTHSSEARTALEVCLHRLNGSPGDPGSFDELDRLIDSQHYRLARWQAGAHGTNYRRFFAIDTLVGLRMEDPHVFEESHARLRDLIREGLVTGLRIDHVDGLRDPEGYLERLQSLSGPNPLYVLVEKILAPGEPLPPAWATQGTTGYEFIAQLAGLFTDARNEAAFDKIYGDFTGHDGRFDAMVREKKRLILDEMFANTVLTLATTLHERIAIDRRWRDLTVAELGAAIREVIAGFRVYRTYRRQGPVSPSDRAEIEHAAKTALAHNPRIEPAIIHFIRDVLLGDYPEAAAIPPHHEAMKDWALTVQQYTGAVTAKAVEDTAYYTFNRLVALNEVGGEPGVFGRDVEAFHQAGQTRLALTPQTMLTTSTHDTKMSEDVRARLYALSEIPGEWLVWLDEWRTLNAVHKTNIDGRPAPDADEEYRLYQMLLGAWPLPPATPDESFRARITGYLRKAVSEAKVNTSILHPNERWLEACDRFVGALLSREHAFVSHIQPAAARLARLGMINSLAQVVLKLTAPGVPDIYQGNESWDFSLVDPDNRREVDHARLQTLVATSTGVPFAELFARWETGEIKLALTRCLLRFRREHPRLFRDGTYAPLEITGKLAGHAVGFTRSEGAGHLAVLVPRFTSRLNWPPIGEAWEDTHARFADHEITWSSVLTGGRITGRETVALQEVFADLPVAVLYARTS
jgi:(1->4)-alpha-D-glucan 1-alpha-D-glucosylmutase